MKMFKKLITYIGDEIFLAKFVAVITAVGLAYAISSIVWVNYITYFVV